MWSAAGKPLSWDSATRLPDPVTTKAIAFPGAQFCRPMISCTIEPRSGVRYGGL